MFAAGLLEEVRGLAAAGRLSRTARQALGYKEVLDHLDRGIPLEETMLNIKRRSRNYAKRQITWFRRIPGLRWFELDEEELYTVSSRVMEVVRDHLEKELASGHSH
jgi:tRNA dimethylallyltransferase